MPVKNTWYQPDGGGALDAPGCGVPKDEMDFALDRAGSYLSVTARPVGYEQGADTAARPWISYSILLAPGARFRLIAPVLVILSPEGKELARYPIDSITRVGSSVRPQWTDISGDAEISVPPDAPVNEGYVHPLAEHYIFGVIPEALPDRFRIRYPDYEMNGQRFRGQEVSYEKRQGIFLAHRCFF
jgi:hypothetical protein